MTSMSIFDTPEQLKVNLCGVVRIPADPAVVCLRHANAEARPDYVVRMADRLSCAKARLRSSSPVLLQIPKFCQNCFKIGFALTMPML